MWVPSTLSWSWGGTTVDISLFMTAKDTACLTDEHAFALATVVASAWAFLRPNLVSKRFRVRGDGNKVSGTSLLRLWDVSWQYFWACLTKSDDLTWYSLLPTHSDKESKASLSHKGDLPLRPGKGVPFLTQSFQIWSVCGFKLYFWAREALVSTLSRSCYANHLLCSSVSISELKSLGRRPKGQRLIAVYINRVHIYCNRHRIHQYANILMWKSIRWKIEKTIFADYWYTHDQTLPNRKGYHNSTT